MNKVKTVRKSPTAKRNTWGRFFLKGRRPSWTPSAKGLRLIKWKAKQEGKTIHEAGVEFINEVLKLAIADLDQRLAK